MFLSEVSVRRPVATAMFFLAMVILGVISLTRLSVDLLPDIAYPRLSVWTSYTDVPPVEVEELVTVPIEQAVSTLSRLRRLRSISKEGISLVMMEFLWGTDMDIAALNVREKLDNLRWLLPRDAGRPTILRLDPHSQPVMSLSVTGGDLVALKELTRNVFKRRLEQIKGVALAAVVGGFEREIQVEVNSRKLTALGLSIEQVASALASANRNLPGGTIKKGRYRYALRTLGEFQSVQDLREVVVSKNNHGSVIPLKDVAMVVDGFKEREAITRFNGREAIGVVITKEAGSNSVEVSKLVREVLQQLSQEYSEVQIAVASDQAEFISQAIANVLQAVIWGGILAFLVLFFFLQDLRNPIYISTAIPIAILAAFALMFFSGVSLNMISLGGLALGVGMLVDNSIVVLENIFRHRETGIPAVQAATKGSREVAMPVLASTLTTIAVFFPIIYVRGVAGQLFTDQSLTVTYSLLASLLVSLILLPMLAARFRPTSADGADSPTQSDCQSRIYRSLFESKDRRRTKFVQRTGEYLSRLLQKISGCLRKFCLWLIEWAKALLRFWWQGLSKLTSNLTRPMFQGFNRGFAGFANHYERLLIWSLHNRKKVVATALVALGFAVLTGFMLDRRLMPEVEQREFTVKITMPPGTSLEATSQMAGEIEHLLLKHPDVASIFSRIGFAAEQSSLLLEESELNQAQILVRLRENASQSTADFMASLREKLRNFSDAEITLESGSTLLTQFLGTAESDFVVKISGGELTVLKDLLQQAMEQIKTVSGLTDLHSSFEEGRPEIRIAVDRELTSRHGLTVRRVAQFVQNHMSGSVSTQFKDFDRKIDILVRPDVSARDELSDLLNSQIQNGKQTVPVRQLLKTVYTQGPTEIRREDQVRQLQVYGNIQGRGFREVVDDIEQRLATIEQPYDYQIAVGGQREEMQRSFRSLILAFLLAAALVYMILAAQFESLMHPLIIIFAVPLAVIGVVLALFITGQSLNVMSLIGCVVLIGIVVNDAIIKVDFINQERRRGTELFQAIMEAGRKRLRPIIMTTVTTVLGLLPMALGLGAGAELRRPLAVAVIGGLLSATFLTLVVVPVVYSLMGGVKIKTGDALN
ncbi:MAG: efflux RND transporter permease subunit [bacterium]